MARDSVPQNRGVSTNVPAPRDPSTRSGRSARDIVLSIAVLLVPILLLLGAYRVFYSGDKPIAIDASGTWSAARHSAPYQVLEPAGLRSGWTLISATYANGTLRVGYVTPGRAGLQLVESDQSADSLLPAELGNDARPGSLVTLGGRSWRAYPLLHDGGRALVLVDQGRTVVVQGTGTDSDVRELASSLR